MKITDKELIERIKPLLEKIVYYHPLSSSNESEKPEIAEIYATEFGRIFGSQIDQILDFGIRGQIVSILPKMLEYIKSTAKTMTSGDFTDLVESQVDEEEFQNVQLFVQNIDLDDLDTFDLILPKSDRLWYISLISFAVHTYLDVYSRALIEMIGKNPQLCEELEDHLVRLARKKRDTTRNPVLKVKEMTRFGVEKRFKEIERGLGIDKILAESIDIKEIDSWRGAFSKFQDIRHKIAHRNPKPELSEYTYDTLENDIGEVTLDFEDLDINPTVAHLLKGDIKILQGVLNDIANYVKKTVIVVAMASLYPALLDVVLFAKANY